MSRGFNIGIFRSALNDRDNVLRPNLALVEFTIPLGLFGIDNFQRNVNTVQTMEYWCEGATLPEFIVVAHQAARYGYGAQEKRPFLPAFQDATFMFIGDGEDNNFRFFYQWINIITNADMRDGPIATPTDVAALSSNFQPKPVGMAPYELSYPIEYKTDVRIILYDVKGQPQRVVNLREAFPIMIGQIQTHWSDNNSYIRQPISFSFTDWYTQEPGWPGFPSSNIVNGS